MPHKCCFCCTSIIYPCTWCHSILPTFYKLLYIQSCVTQCNLKAPPLLCYLMLFHILGMEFPANFIIFTTCMLSVYFSWNQIKSNWRAYVANWVILPLPPTQLEKCLGTKFRLVAVGALWNVPRVCKLAPYFITSGAHVTWKLRKG